MTGVPLHRTLWSELLKLRRSFVLPLLIAGGALVPAGMTAARLRNPDAFRVIVTTDTFWEQSWNQCWESLAVMLLPLGALVTTALVSQHEHRANAWKLLHATPQHPLAIYFAKFVIAYLLLLVALGFQLLALWAGGWAPCLLFAAMPCPDEPFPTWLLVRRGSEFLRDVSPIVAAQLALGLGLRSVVWPMGLGIVLWVVATLALSTDLGWIVPYGYAALDYFDEVGARTGRTPIALSTLAVLQTVVLFTFGAAIYGLRSDRS